MRLFLKIIYALTLALGLFLVYSYSEQYYRIEEIGRLGNEAIADNNFDFFVASKYYNQQPLRSENITIDEFEFDLYIYEVASYRRVNNEIITVDGISIFLHQKDGHELHAQLSVVVESNDDVSKEYTLLKYGNLPIYTVVNQGNNTPIVERSHFTDEDDTYAPIEKLVLTINDSSTINILFDPLLDNEFIIKDQLMEHYDNEEEPLEIDYLDITVMTPLLINSNPLMWLWVALYTIAVVLGTLLLRKWLKTKDMGKKELTPGLERDLDLLNKKDQSN